MSDDTDPRAESVAPTSAPEEQSSPAGRHRLSEPEGPVETDVVETAAQADPVDSVDSTSQGDPAESGDPDEQDSLLSRLRLIEGQPLEERAVAFGQLHDELSAVLEGADAPGDRA